MIIIHYHAALKYLLKKFDSKPCLIRWVLHLQDLDLETQGKASHENVVADHLFWLGPEATPIKELSIDDSFSDDHLLAISYLATP